MTIVLSLPEDIAKALSAQQGDLSRAAMESLALEGYRSHHLSEEQVRRMLGFDSRWDVHAFLKQHGVYLNYTKQELEDDLAKPLVRP
jgi:TorA maturation chaperone TorD